MLLIVLKIKFGLFVMQDSILCERRWRCLSLWYAFSKYSRVCNKNTH